MQDTTCATSTSPNACALGGCGQPASCPSYARTVCATRQQWFSFLVCGLTREEAVALSGIDASVAANLLRDVDFRVALAEARAKVQGREAKLPHVVSRWRRASERTIELLVGEAR